jgi:pimeloyl-ACP methyl ester carboxylesterase
MISELLHIACALFALTACHSTRTYEPERNTRTVMVDDLAVAYFDAGSGPLVVLLHGFPDTPHTWDAIAPRLASAGFHVVMPFARGYAPTAIPSADSTIGTLGRDVLGLIRALGEQHAILVGHDWGALAAYAAASFDPSHIDKLVTVAIPHPIALFKHAEIPFAPHFMELAAPGAEVMVRQDDFRYLDELIGRWSPTWHVPDGTTDAVKNAFTAPGSLAAALGYYRAVGSNLPPELLVPLAMPALTFYGTNDHATDPRVFVDQHTAFTGSFELVAEPVGHFVQLEAADAFVAKLLDFLAR